MRHFAKKLPATLFFISICIHNSFAGLKPPPLEPSSPDINKAHKEKLLLESPVWGKTIENASGEITYSNYMKKSFSGSIELKNLEPNYSYVLCINGKPGQPGNEKLPGRFGREGKFDFKQIRTDANGNYSGQFSISLPPGNYDVKFFVKDKTDWQIVLYNDFLIFTIESGVTISYREGEVIYVINNASEDVAVTAAYYCSNMGREDGVKTYNPLVSGDERQFPVRHGFLVVIRVFNKKGHKIQEKSFDFRQLGSPCPQWTD